MNITPQLHYILVNKFSSRVCGPVPVYVLTNRRWSYSLSKIHTHTYIYIYLPVPMCSLTFPWFAPFLRNSLQNSMWFILLLFFIQLHLFIIHITVPFYSHPHAAKLIYSLFPHCTLIINRREREPCSRLSRSSKEWFFAFAFLLVCRYSGDSRTFYLISAYILFRFSFELWSIGSMRATSWATRISIILDPSFLEHVCSARGRIILGIIYWLLPVRDSLSPGMGYHGQPKTWKDESGSYHTC